MFGKLVHGLDVLRKIEDADDGDGKPNVTVKIINCGVFDGGKILHLVANTQRVVILIYLLVALNCIHVLSIS